MAIVVAEQFDLIVPESLFLSPRRPAMLWQMCNGFIVTGQTISHQKYCSCHRKVHTWRIDDQSCCRRQM